MALFFTACLNTWKGEQWSLSSVRTCLFPISAAWCKGRGTDGEMAGRQDRQVSVSPQPGPFPRVWATSSSALCRADTWHRARRNLGSSLSWVMRLGLLGAFNYQPDVQKRFSLETFTQAKPLFTKKASCFLFLAKKIWLEGEISLWRNLSCSSHDRSRLRKRLTFNQSMMKSFCFWIARLPKNVISFLFESKYTLFSVFFF